MNQRFVVANWKMNPETEAEAVELFGATRDVAKTAPSVTVVVAPPFTFLSPIEHRYGLANAETRREAKIHLAAQDLFWERDGAFTGEVSGAMEKNIGATHVIVGHSERRRVLAETDEMVAKKLKKALEFGLVPILCIGENERLGGEIPERVGDELKSAMAGLEPSELRRIIIAYEPVWAIDSGKPDTPEGMLSAAIYIRKILTEIFSQDIATQVPILYGGSVNSANVSSFFTETSGQVSGVLVGGASLDSHEIAAIITVVGHLSIISIV